MPTPEEIKKARKNLEAELMGGTTSVQIGSDIMGIPKITMPTTYVPGVSLPPGISLSQVSQTPGIAQTNLDKLVDLELELEKEKYKKVGIELPPEEVKKRREEIYQKNYDDYIKPALGQTYGTFGEKKAGPQVLTSAIKVPDAPSVSSKVPGGPSIFDPFKVQSKSIEPVEDEINWDVVTQSYMKESGKSEEDATKDIREFKDQYNLYRQTFPDKSAEEAFKGINEFMQGLQNVPEIQRPEEIEKEFSEAEGGAMSKAFSKNLEAKGIMPPDYTPEQMTFVKQNMKKDYNKITSETFDSLQKNPDQTVPGIIITTDAGFGQAVDVPLVVYEAIMASNPKLPGYQPIYDAKTDDLIRNGIPGKKTDTKVNQSSKSQNGYARSVALSKVGDPDAWYLDPKSKEIVLSNPENFVESGWLSKTNAFGDVKESTGMYSLRMLLSPLNAFAAVAQPVAEYTVGTIMGVPAVIGEAVGILPELPEGESYFDPGAMSRQRQKARAKDTPLYEDSPILANIAMNKGFTGEAEDVAKTLNLSGATKYAVIGGGFLMDIASPDIAIISSAVKTAKVGAPVIGDAARINKAMYGTSGKAIDNAIEGLKAGKNTFMDDLNGVSAIMSKTEWGKTPYASLTSKIADTNAEVLKAYRGIQEGINAEQAIKNLPDNHPFVVAVRNANDPKTVDVFASVRTDPNNAKILKEWQETSTKVTKMFDEGKSIDEIVDVSGLSREWLDAVAMAKTGKNFTDLNSLGMGVEDLLKLIDKNYATGLTINTLGAKALSDTDKIFALTKNTWAHEKSIGKVIAGANETPLGKVLAKIRNTGKVAEQTPFAAASKPFKDPVIPPTGATGSAVRKIGKTVLLPSLEPKAIFLVDAQTLKELEDVLPDEYKAFLSDGKINFEEFNTLVNHNIDNYAKTTSEALTGETLSMLSDKTQHLILEKGSDGLLARGARKLMSIVQRDELTIENPLPTSTIQQKQLMKDIKARASMMDTQLRRDMDVLMANNDDVIRSLYRITQPKGTKLSSEQALGYAIMGKFQEGMNPFMMKNIDNLTLRETTEYITELVFYARRQNIGLFSSVDGSNQLKYNQLLNEPAIAEWNRILMEKFVPELTADHSKLVDMLFKKDGIIDQYKTLLSNPNNLRATVDPKLIGGKIEKAKDELTKIMIGSYYRTEGQRIINSELQKAVRDGILKTDTNAIMGNELASSWMKINKQHGKAFNDITKTMIERNLNNPHTEVWDIVAEYADNAGIPGVKKASDAKNLAEIVEGLPTYQKQIVDVIARTVRKADETANIILMNNGLSHNKMATDMNKVQSIFDILKFTDTPDLGRVVIGAENYNEFIKLVSEGRLASISQELDIILRDQSLGVKGLQMLFNFFTGVNKLFYPMLLSFRPSFHGGNIFSAPFIVYQTTGTLAGANPKYVNKGRRIAFNASTPNSRYYYEIATIDKAGRAWTYGELNKLMLESGVESKMQAMTTVMGSSDVENYLIRHSKGKKNLWQQFKSIISAPGDTLGQLTIKEDLTFRSAAMLEALESGKSIEEAMTVARTSLFDYKDMAEWERAYASRYLVFYSFMRANLGHFVKSLGDAKSLKSYMNTMKFKRGTDIVMARANEGTYVDDRFFFGDTFTSKFFLGMSTTEEGQTIGIMSPSIPALDAPVQFFQMLYDPIEFVGAQAQGMLRPSIKNLLDILPKFNMEYEKVPPQFVDINRFSENSPEEIAAFYQAWLGGIIVPLPATQDEGAVNGYIYPLDSEQAKKLRFIIDSFNTVGVLTMYQDWYNIFSGQGTPKQEISSAIIPFTKQQVIPNREKIELGNIRARRSAIEQQMQELSRQLREGRKPEEQ